MNITTTTHTTRPWDAGGFGLERPATVECLPVTLADVPGVSLWGCDLRFGRRSDEPALVLRYIQLRCDARIAARTASDRSLRHELRLVQEETALCETALRRAGGTLAVWLAGARALLNRDLSATSLHEVTRSDRWYGLRLRAAQDRRWRARTHGWISAYDLAVGDRWVEPIAGVGSVEVDLLDVRDRSMQTLSLATVRVLEDGSVRDRVILGSDRLCLTAIAETETPIMFGEDVR
tara:strand:- start:37352 stop:38056 length:705 start_codon:yes stop_codon:yes gene_type:complete